jgi:thioredoxin-related protein
MRNFFFTLIFVSLTLNLNAQIDFFKGSWPDLLSKAKTENKGIFVDAFTTWCMPCTYMSKNIFTQPAVGEFYNSNYINVKLDMESPGEGVEFAKKYQITAYPTMLYFNPQGELVHKIVGGYQPEDFIAAGKDFIAAGKDALNPDQQYYTLQKKFDGGVRDSSLVVRYFDAAERLNDKDVLAKIAAEYLGKTDQNKWHEKSSWKYIKHFTIPDTKYFQFILNNRKLFEDSIGREEIFQFLVAGYDQKLQLIIDQKSESGLATFKNEVVNVFADKSDFWKAFAEMRFSSEATTDTVRAVKAMDIYLMDHVKDASVLNDQAWKIYETKNDPASINMAIKWVKKSLEIERNYYNLDTYAHLLYKSGNKTEAKKAAEDAIAIGEKTKENTSETEKLLNRIKGRSSK